MKEPIQTNGSTQPDSFRLEDFLPFRLSVAADAVSRLIARQHLSKTGLGMSEWRLLASVGRYGMLSPTAAGEQTAMDKVKVSRAAASLVSRGLLKQTQDPKDGRARQLRLTRKGTNLYTEVGNTAGMINAELSVALSRAEWTALNKTLGKLSGYVHTVLVNGADDNDP